jgi:hypothetical protein
MPPSLSLQAAANAAYDDMFVWWQSTQLKARLTGFGVQAALIFSDDNPNDRTVGDWFVPIQALATIMGAAVQPLTQFNAAVQYVYRICWQGDAMQTAGLITPAQAAALLVQFNTWFT